MDRKAHLSDIRRSFRFFIRNLKDKARDIFAVMSFGLILHFAQDREGVDLFSQKPLMIGMIEIEESIILDPVHPFHICIEPFLIRVRDRLFPADPFSDLACSPGDEYADDQKC